MAASKKTIGCMPWVTQIKEFIDKLLRQNVTVSSTSTPGVVASVPSKNTTDTTAPEATPDAPLSIVILGAGIAGLALAIGLAKRGVPCAVYDAGEAFSAIGAGIGLGPNSLQAIDMLDPRFRNLYDTAKTANKNAAFRHSVFDALLAEDGFGEQRGWRRGLVGAPYFERSSAHRKALLDIMASLVPAGTVHFSKRAVSVNEVEGTMTGEKKVEICFADGTKVMADAVVGADGIRGVTRKAVLGDAAPDLVAPKYTGMYIYRGIVPMEDAKTILGEHAGNAKWFMAKDRGVAIYPISKGAEANFVFFVVDPCKEWTHASGSNMPCSKEAMLDDLRGFDPRLRRLLDWAKPLRWPIYHHPQTPVYYRGPVCMIGDCAHATSPHQASGAGMGLEDAVVMASLLPLVRERGQIEVAFRVFDSIRRPRCTQVVKTSEEAGALFTFNNPAYGDDMMRIVENANGRLHWIWQHDLRADQMQAKEKFCTLVGEDEGNKASINSSSATVETKTAAFAAEQEVPAGATA